MGELEAKRNVFVNQGAREKRGLDKIHIVNGEDRRIKNPTPRVGENS